MMVIPKPKKTDTIKKKQITNASPMLPDAVGKKLFRKKSQKIKEEINS